MSDLWLSALSNTVPMSLAECLLTALEFTDPPEGLVHPPEHMFSGLWQVLLTSALPFSHTVHSKWTTIAMKKKALLLSFHLAILF